MPRSILIVDDEPDLLEVIALELEFSGFHVLKAVNGKQALQIIRNHVVDAVLSDIRMPHGDGLELLSALMGERRFTPPLLFMSGYSDCDEEHAFHRGAVGYFHKPLEKTELVSALREYAEPKILRWRQGPRMYPTSHVEGSVFQTQHKLLLGRGGFSIWINQSDAPHKVMQSVSFALELEGLRKILGEGTVRWVRRDDHYQQGWGLGIEIKYMDEASLTLFEEYIEEQELISYIPLS